MQYPIVFLANASKFHVLTRKLQFIVRCTICSAIVSIRPCCLSLFGPYEMMSGYFSQAQRVFLTTSPPVAIGLLQLGTSSTSTSHPLMRSPRHFSGSEKVCCIKSQNGILGGDLFLGLNLVLNWISVIYAGSPLKHG